MRPPWHGAAAPSRPGAPLRLALLPTVLLAALVAHPAASQPQAPAWPVAGQQGLVRVVIVPVAEATDRSAYDRQIEKLCQPERTCFLNFHTNSTDAPLAVPLPDAIAQEATAVFRRSMKNGVSYFTWACRLRQPGGECF